MLTDWIAEKIPQDKLLHFTFSLVLMRVFSVFAGDKITYRLLTALAVLSIGVLKELYDKKRGEQISKGDLIADALGVLIGLI
jgi:hypothetical protein|nr:MAG TPA: putative periplasmic lipoprotein [Caudoviricetes sp.]